MGYMSTNVFSTSEKGFARLNELVEKNQGTKRPGFEVPRYSIEEHVDGGVVFGYEWDKFYGCWFDPFHEAWAEFVSEGHPYTMVRYGEEADDSDETWSENAWDAGIPMLALTRGWEICA